METIPVHVHISSQLYTNNESNQILKSIKRSILKQNNSFRSDPVPGESCLRFWLCELISHLCWYIFGPSL